MRIVSHVIIAIPRLTEVPARIVEKWTKHLEGSTEQIKEGIKKRIPDGKRFVHRVAESAQRGYSDFVNKDFRSRAGLSQEQIAARYHEKLAHSYEKYKDGVDYMYETVDGKPAQRFKDRVNKSTKHYSKGAGKTVLCFAGTKLEGLGPAPKAAAWLSGDHKIIGDMTGADQVHEGGPFLVTTKTKRPSLRSALNQRLIQAGVIITDCKNKPTMMKEQNDLTNELIQGLVDKTLNLVEFQTGGDSRVDYFLDKNGQVYLDIQVSQR
ncbi:hypothetical protein ACFL5I_01940 [Planctomycetota bacterium]